MVHPYPLESLCHVCTSSCRFQCAFPANSQHRVCLSEDCPLAAWSRKARSCWKCTSLGAVFSQWWLGVRVFFAPSWQDPAEARSRTSLQGSCLGQHLPVVFCCLIAHRPIPHQPFLDFLMRHSHLNDQSLILVNLRTIPYHFLTDRQTFFKSHILPTDFTLTALLIWCCYVD